MSDISIYKRSNKSFTLTVYDADDEVQDLTGATVTLQVKRQPGDLYTALIEKTTTGDAGITIEDQTDPTTTGKCTIEFEPADTADMTAGWYYYDVVVTLDGVKTYVITPSKFRILDVVNSD